MRVLVEYHDGISLNSTEAKARVKALLDSKAIVKTIPDSNDAFDFLLFACEEFASAELIDAYYTDELNYAKVHEDQFNLLTKQLAKAYQLMSSNLERKLSTQD
jgi:hypothetical protein